MNIMTSGHKRKHAGFTLIEVLVSLLVFSIGLLGLAALQLQSLKFNQSAYQRSQASLMAYDVLDRMRSNVLAARNGNYNIGLDDPGTLTSCTGTGVTCTSAQIATFDLFEWKQALAAVLPKGDGSIQESVPVTTPATFIITIEWSDDRENVDATPLFFVLRTSP